MSVAAIARVWERSGAKGADLLVLLAIADYAEEDGRNSWPTETKLAAKSRMSDRGVRKILGRLVAMGELAIEKNDDARRVRDGHCPRRFMHVLCCRQPEQRSGSNRNSVPVQQEQRSGSNRNSVPVQPEQRSGSGDRRTGTSGSVEPEQGGTRNKEDPSGIRQEENPARAREVDPRRTHPLDEPRVLEPAAVQAFDELWALYPRKLEGKLGALRAWHALQPCAEQATFIVEAVRVRIRLGWARYTPVKFLPSLRTFLDERRWTQAYEPPVAVVPPLVAAPDGLLVMRSCQACSAVVEGRVVNGLHVYPPCRCEAGEVST